MERDRGGERLTLIFIDILFKHDMHSSTRRGGTNREYTLMLNLCLCLFVRMCFVVMLVQMARVCCIYVSMRIYMCTCKITNQKLTRKLIALKKKKKKSVHKHRVNRNDALLLNIRDKHTFGRITFLSRAEQCVDTQKKCIRKRAYE